MNNIEILENFIRIYKELDKKSTDFYFNKAEIPIEDIENLIQENKELKEEVLHWKGKYHLENRKYIQLHNEKIDAPVIEATEEMLKQYIPKSKVKEKIEELEKERKRKDEEDIINPFYDQIDITHIIEVLQELLEE